jgi:hypothetical protein
MTHGLFAHETRDAAKPVPATDDAVFLKRLSALRGRASSPQARAVARKLASLSHTRLLDASIELGRSLRGRSAVEFRDLLHAVGEWGGPGSWIAEAGLGHGALSSIARPATERTVAALEQLASGCLWALFPRAASAWA